MVIFLLTSFLSFLLVGLALLIEPPSFGTLHRIPGLGYINIDIDETVVAKVRRALLAFCILLVIVVIFSLHYADVSWNARYVPNFIIGLLFGPLFAIWMAGVLRTRVQDGLSAAQIVQGIVLILLFVVGLLGTETANLVDRLARNVSKVGIGGAEISFMEPKKGPVAGAVSAGPSSIAPGTGSRGLNPTLGLKSLTDMENLIQRDCQYIQLSALAAANPDRALFSQIEDFVDEHACEINKTPSKINEAQLTLLQRRFGDKATPLIAQIRKLDAARSFVGLAVADYANCLSGVLDQTADAGFVRDHLTGLAPPLQEATMPGIQVNLFVNKAVDAAANETYRLFSDIYPIFLAKAVSRDKDAPGPADSQSQRDDVRKQCGPLLVQLCEPDETIADKIANSQTPADDLKNWLDDDKTDTKLKNCASTKADVPSAASVDVCPAAPAIAGPSDARPYNEGITREALLKRHKRRLAQHFCANFMVPDSDKLDKELDYTARPYVWIAYTGVMVQLGRYEAGLAKLYEWLQQYEKPHKVDEDSSITRLGADEYKLWFAIRARSMLIAYMEEWLRPLSGVAWDRPRKFHLENLSRFFDQMENFGLFEAPLAEIRRGEHDLDKEGYRTEPDDSGDCKIYDKSNARATLTYAYLINKLLFTYNALQVADYDQEYSRVAKNYVQLVMNANLACLSAGYGTSASKQLRAEALDLQAQILFRDALAKRASDVAAARDLARKARDAATLGNSLILKYWERDVATSQTATGLSQRIAAGHTNEVYTSLQQTLKSAQSTLDNLD